ncbi:MAG: phosphopantetheine-binding protein [Deltaproteobacteria bacterium]|nr:phosphopantetheine-binding protein [Deltaproteobacteria bacterium]
MKTVEILESEIKELIVEALALEDLIPSELDSTEPLFDSGLGLDSIDALEIAVALEKRYGIVVDDDAGANRERFASVRSLARFVADSLPR